MKRLNKFLSLAAAVMAFAAISCNNMETPETEQQAANVSTPSTPSTPSTHNYKPRHGASVEAILIGNEAEWNKPIPANGKVVFAFEANPSDDRQVTRIQVRTRPGSGDDWFIYLDIEGENIGRNGNTWFGWLNAQTLMGERDYMEQLHAADQGILQSFIAFKDSAYRSEELTPDFPVEVTFEGSGTAAPQPWPPIDTPPRPTMSNIRWATSKDGIRTENKANWNPVLKRDDALYVGIDTPSAEVKEAKFTITRNGRNEVWTMDSRYMGAIDENTIWLVYPNRPTDFLGTLGMRIDITYKDGTTRKSDTLTTTVEPKGIITNIRWGNSLDSVKSTNKADWNKALKSGDRLFIGIDANADVVAAKIYLAKNDTAGKNRKNNYIPYANLGEYNDWGKIDGNSLWFEYAKNPTDFTGEAKISIELKLNDGTRSGTLEYVDVTVPVM